MSGPDEIIQRYLELLRQGRDEATRQRLRDALDDLLMSPQMINATYGEWYGFTVREDPAMPPDELHLEVDGRRVGKLLNIRFVAREPEGEPREVKLEARQIRTLMQPWEGEGELTEEGRRALNEAIKASYERQIRRALELPYRQYGAWEPPARLSPATIPYEPERRYISSVFGRAMSIPSVTQSEVYVSPTMGLADPAARPKVPGRVIYDVYDVPVSRGGRRRHRRERKKKRGRAC
jgi:hypothetical protein